MSEMLIEVYRDYQTSFDLISLWLPKPPLDYFDFPASATAFCHSLKNSKPFFFGDCLFRKRGKVCKLVSFRGQTPVQDIEKLRTEGFVVKTLPFSFRDGDYGPLVRAKHEYYANLPYLFEQRIAHHSHGNRGRLRRDYRQGTERFSIAEDVQRDEFEKLFQAWLEVAQDRYFMVRKGHHHTYADMYFAGVGNIRLLGFRRKDDGRLFGVMGFEVVGDQAQMTLGKHLFGDNAFSTFYYVKTLELISDMGVKRVLCGSSGDEFKSRIGLEKKSSWKLKLST